MDRGFYNEDFDLEQLLQQRSDQYRMYPSDKVWRNIRRTIRHARYGYGLALLLLLGGGSYLSYKNDLFTPPSSQRTITILASSPAKKERSPSSLINPVNRQTAEFIKIRKSGTPLTSKTSTAVVKKPSTAKPASAPYPYDDLHAVGMQNIGNVLNGPIATLQPHAIHETKSLLEGGTVAVFQQQEANQESMPPSVPAEHTSTDLSVNDHSQINWLQEKAAYELSRPRSKKLSWQLHATPTVNYRNIVGQKMVNISSELTNIPLALNIQGNIDNLLNHKPAMGFEMGTAVLYALNKRMTVKAGAQFNYSSYDIQAYSSTASERATIALSTVMGSESLTSYTNIRNFGGDQLKALKNEYYQLSVPIGMEYTLLGGRRVQLSVAGTFQPTYMLNHDNYLITTDYKNYTREPSLLRRFNLNTSAEAFLSYNMGDMRIQLGPQFRYQIFSSFTSRYPLQEHLKEFGFKLGITKSIR